ncbi:MAG: adenylate/guanylate cyclase domain-containing protein [Betaproteobacteria bacterium]|nr:adenylate/guanylate cyclase domain-containing protein [Betaproteobacteria bacterium]
MEAQIQAAVLFADVSGSTKLYDRAGDTIAHAAISKCVDMFKRVTLANGGIVIKTIGDEVMATFPSADQAAKAATTMQIEITAMPEPVEGVQLGARIGFHFGSVVPRDNDVFGDTVNLAARLTDLASKGQIITDDETVKILAPLLRADCRRLYSIPVKGKADEVGIVEMVWQESEDATQVARTRVQPVRQAGQLTLRHGDRTLVMPGAKTSISLGRDASTDMVVADKMASRIHCEIELRMDKYVLSDRSANGTYVFAEGQGEMILRREEAILRGRGLITLGQSHATATEKVEFQVD